jgi:hypothetical protein
MAVVFTVDLHDGDHCFCVVTVQLRRYNNDKHEQKIIANKYKGKAIPVTGRGGPLGL